MRVNRKTGMSHRQWIGKRLKRMSFRNRIVHGNSEIKINNYEYATLLKQYGYAAGESAKPYQLPT